jgi:hypothetical protein
LKARPVVDGQRRPREPDTPIDLLDSVGLDRRMTEQPMVFELSGFDAFVAAGGWVDTIPADLGSVP